MQTESFEWSSETKEYVIDLEYDTNSLSINALNQTDGSAWRSAFTSKEIEEITLNTGNFKKFTVFVKMLIQSFSEDSDTLAIDILNYEELKNLRKNKRKPSPNPTSSNNNLFVILSYVTNFDKVHYVLCLAFTEEASSTSLNLQIKKLTKELGQTREQLAQMVKVKKENTILREEVTSLQKELAVAKQTIVNLRNQQKKTSTPGRSTSQSRLYSPKTTPKKTQASPRQKQTPPSARRISPSPTRTKPSPASARGRTSLSTGRNRVSPGQPRTRTTPTTSHRTTPKHAGQPPRPPSARQSLRSSASSYASNRSSVASSPRGRPTSRSLSAKGRQSSPIPPPSKKPTTSRRYDRPTGRSRDWSDSEDERPQRSTRRSGEERKSGRTARYQGEDEESDYHYSKSRHSHKVEHGDSDSSPSSPLKGKDVTKRFDALNKLLERAKTNRRH
ncbi:putative variable flagellar number 3 [Blattamonas nauphoetae]|uniref:Variable flagellar number 3 n=1 Tax=Blattamonas nauphoetae TaxID=2049346 RepID=A0ABQ9YI71_9EUKA|nr:putative variable flagellar number 3 [Blattamonas nauphoetae]